MNPNVSFLKVVMDIDGFLKESKHDTLGGVYRGRLTLPGVQWTGVGSEAFATFTMTADQLADAAENRLIWTDQSVQRGVNPAAPRGVPRELNLADGYPNKNHYIFDGVKADEIVNKLLSGGRLFLNPLVWNLRPSDFSAFWSENEKSIYLYSGKIFLPDSHHRHQAILKAVRAIREHPLSFPHFNGDRQFKIELYFLDKEGEGNYFFDKNQLPKPTANSKAYDLTTMDDLSMLAKRVIDQSPTLIHGVNRVTDRLTKKSPHFITLSTLREMMKTYAGSDEIDETEFEGLAKIAAFFIEMLAKVRPEFTPVDSSSGTNKRDDSLAVSAVMMHGYAYLMKNFNLDVGKMGLTTAQDYWKRRLQKLSPNRIYTNVNWEGDFFNKNNPIWTNSGVVKINTTTGVTTVLNSGGARSAAAKILLDHLNNPTEANQPSLGMPS